MDRRGFFKFLAGGAAAAVAGAIVGKQEEQPAQIKANDDYLVNPVAAYGEFPGPYTSGYMQAYDPALGWPQTITFNDSNDAVVEWRYMLNVSES